MSLAERGVLIRREKPSTTQSTSPIIPTISINSSSKRKIFINSSFTNRSSVNRSYVNSSSANRLFVNSSSTDRISINRSYENSISTNNSSANRFFVNSSSTDRISINRSYANISSTNNNSANKVSTNRFFVNSSSPDRIFINRSRANSTSTNGDFVNRRYANNSSANRSSTNRSTTNRSSTSVSSVNRSYANISSTNSSSANSSSANRIYINRSFINSSSVNRSYANRNSANRSFTNGSSINRSYTNSSSANRSYANSSSANRISMNNSSTNGSSGNMESLNNTLHATPSLYRRKLEKYIKYRELMLPQLSFSIIWESPILQSLLMRDEYSKYVMTEDELNNLQWELEAMLTTINVRQTAITNELLTYHASMYIDRRPKVRSRVVKQISSINTFDHNIKVKFGSICYELPPRKIESAIFWSFIKPYLAYMPKYNFGWLIDMVEYYILNKELFNIPPIGEHYSIKWVKKELETYKMQEKLPSFLIDIMNKVNYFKYDENVYVAKYERVVINVAENSQTSQDFVDKDKSQEISTVGEEFNSEQSVHYKSILQLKEELKTPLNISEILNVERPQNKLWIEEQKIDYIAKLDDKLHALSLRDPYRSQIQTILSERENNESISCDSSSSEYSDSDNSSDDESNTTRVYVVTEPSEHSTNIKQNIKTKGECLTGENIKSKVTDRERVKDDVMNIEYNK